MEFIKHPKVVKSGGYSIQIATLFPVTDQQALLIARQFLRLQGRKLKKSDRNKLLTVPWHGDRDALALL